MASRESFNIWREFNRNSKKFWDCIKILFFIKRGKYVRRLIIKDSFNVPFNKKFGCKLFGHNWGFIDDEEYYVCWKCFKHEEKDEHKISQRDDKIDKLLR